MRTKGLEFSNRDSRITNHESRITNGEFVVDSRLVTETGANLESQEFRLPSSRLRNFHAGWGNSHHGTLHNN